MSKHRIIIIIFFSEDQNILKQEDDIRTQVMTLNTIVNMCNVFNFNNLFLDKGCGHKLTHTNKNEISINLFPVCYQSLSIILFCSRLKLSNE